VPDPLPGRGTADLLPVLGPTDPPPVPGTT
jgi:hypothetical protein